ncbi:MAG: hypothetical protein ACYC7D_11365 [Nitrososphaerales archaeon]
MQSYQILGLIGGIITLIVAALLSFMMSFALVGGMMGGFYGGIMSKSGMMSSGYTGSSFTLPFAFMIGFTIIGIVAGILGIAGSTVANRQAAGILLIIGAIISLPVFFGAFGIGFILMLIGGIIALTSGGLRATGATSQSQRTGAPATAPR